MWSRLVFVPAAFFLSLTWMTAAHADSCLSMDDSRTFNRGISTETTIMVNSCPVRVWISWCVDSPTGGGSFSCRRDSFGGSHIAARSSAAISIAGAGNPFTVYWGECQAATEDGYPSSSSQSFSGSSVELTCDE